MRSDIKSEGKGFVVLVNGRKIGTADSMEETIALRTEAHEKYRTRRSPDEDLPEEEED